jgi:hypothetical protein
MSTDTGPPFVRDVRQRSNIPADPIVVPLTTPADLIGSPPLDPIGKRPSDDVEIKIKT